MNLELHAKHFDLTDRVQEYVQRKVGKLDRYLPGISATRVDLAHGVRHGHREVYTAQVTAWVDGSILRGEEMHDDVFAAIDLVADKMHRQMERYKGKRLHRWHDHSKPIAPPEEPPAEVEVDHPGPAVVRRKNFALYPMSESEAAEQLELLGHDFFLFINPDSGNVNVLYRRTDGNLGLIDPETA